MYWQNTQSNLLLEFLNHHRIGVIADMDGTLSHIVQIPADARVTSRNITLLQRLNVRLPLVAILSGRAAAGLQSLVGLPDLVYVGNHGLERWSDGVVHLAPEAEPYRRNIRNAYEALLPYENNGIFIENKAVTLSLHYRQTPDPTTTAKNMLPILETVATEHELALFQGRMVYELRPPITVNKGTAFEALVQDYQLDAVLFLGDDTTDIPALQKARELRERGTCFAIGVGVISNESPAGVKENADILANGVEDVEDLLEWLDRSQSASAT